MDEVIRLCVVLALDILYSIVYSKFSSSIIHSSEPLSELRGGGVVAILGLKKFAGLRGPFGVQEVKFSKNLPGARLLLHFQRKIW